MRMEERRELFQSVFNTQLGIRVIEELEKQTNFKNSSFNIEPLKMARDEGKKEVLRFIKQQLEAK